MTKSFALALGGGGARGLAHIAVLEALATCEKRDAHCMAGGIPIC